MADFPQQGDEADLSLPALGRTWDLTLDRPEPGLTWSGDRSFAHLLELRHVAATGRRDDAAFERTSLVALETRRGRIQATYAPRGWHGLLVRATWGPATGCDGLDLEVQVSTSATVILRRLEVAVDCRWPDMARPDPTPIAYRVEPRDVRAASSSYDGREPMEVLQRLTTLPVPSASPHVLMPLSVPEPGGPPGVVCVQMARPDDCARRIIGELDDDPRSRGASWSRHALFGHDLEKGVVLRGRIRVVRAGTDPAGEEIRRLHEAFLREPPSLGP